MEDFLNSGNGSSWSASMTSEWPAFPPSIQKLSRHCMSTCRSFDRHHKLVIALHMAILAAEQQGKLPVAEWHACVGALAAAAQPAAQQAGPTWLPKDTWTSMHRLAAIPSTQVSFPSVPAARRCTEHLLARLLPVAARVLVVVAGCSS